jgi:dihydrofolate synthase / folylpolyglutamate synthase
MITYHEALAWIYSFSDTERTGAFVRDREDNLPRERALLAALGNPHRTYGVTHIAGTKGKGSTAVLVAAMLRAAGVRTGLYTQPDLHTFRERIRVDDMLISEQQVCDLVPALRTALADIGHQPGPYITYEVATALAFLHFQRAGVEHAVIEVGLGGRLDATNVVEPMVTAITSISYDHMNVLGSTLARIATEKAGIIKPGVPVVCSARAPEALDVIRRISAERGAPLVLVGPEGTAGAAYTYRPGPFNAAAQWLHVRGPTWAYDALELGLLGAHQLENATAAVAVVDQLAAQGLPIDEQTVRTGLLAARWPARMQVVGERPWLVVDGAHNADSMLKLMAGLRRHFRFDRLALVLGVLSDKDLDGMARAICESEPSLVVATAPRTPRAMAPERVVMALHALAPTLPVRAEADAEAAIVTALGAVGPDDLVCVTGSLYVASEALRWFAAHGGAAVMRPIEIAGVDH